MFPLRSIISVVTTPALFGLLLFVPAGTLDWWRAWAFLGAVFVATAATMLAVNEALVRERSKPPIQKGQPTSDKVITLLFIAAFWVCTSFIPLDVFRLQLLPKPGPVVSSLGLVVFLAGWSVVTLALRENAFAASVVRHQKERRQTVINTGLYGVVRHPMYSGSLPLLIGMPLWLESYAGALLVVVPTAVLLARIAVEEELLRRELEGYDEYTRRVRYRLIPFVW